MGKRGETIAKKRKIFLKINNNSLIHLETGFLFVFSYLVFFLIVLPLNDVQTSSSVQTHSKNNKIKFLK